MKIGDLAGATGADVETIRYYERIGLLPSPVRASNGYRQYGDSELERLTFIRHCRALDMPLADIRLLLDYIAQPAVDCSAVTRAVDSQLKRVRARVKALRALEKQLTSLRSQCEFSARPRQCGILHELVTAAHAESCACQPQAASTQRRAHAPSTR